MNELLSGVQSPRRLAVLAVVVIVAIAYLVLQRRRSTYALRLATSDLYPSLATADPGWRRQVPAIGFLLGLALLAVAFAQPTRLVDEPVERATVVVAIDVSLSMEATDVSPSRIDAAKAAAQDFITELPPQLNVGLVAFSGQASVLVPPTQDRLLVTRAIDTLELAESTAIGEAILISLDALRLAPADPDEDGNPPPARIVLLSDGETTVGRPDALAVQAAVEQGVPVSTIAFGTPDGAIVFDDPTTELVENELIPVPVRLDNLRAIADDTGGAFFAAASGDELQAVYDDIGSAVGTQQVDAEITDWFVGAALVVMLLVAAASLAFFQRLP